MIKNQNKAFTLIEILVVIVIISIFFLSTKTLNFRNISNKQKLNIKIVQINSHIEEIRNNALLGRGIGVNLFVPKKYKMEFSTSGSGIIKNTFLSGATYQNYNLFNKKIIFDRYEKISKVSCLELDGTEHILANTETGTILVEGGNMTLSGDCDTTEKILKLEIKRQSRTGAILVNTLNGLIEIEK